MKSILFLCPYPLGKAPSQRFRFEQYFEALNKANIKYQTQSFLDSAAWEVLYKEGKVLVKIVGILKGFIRRFLVLFKLSHYDYVFIHRELTPIGPPIFEFIIARILRKKIVYDFDDAIWRPQFEKLSLINLFKNNSKVNSICKWSYKVSCGNEYLCAYARRFNNNVILNPTTIDTVNLHNRIKDQNSDKVIIGWTGTHSTLCHLETQIEILKELEGKLDFKFYLISNQRPDFNIPSMFFFKWKEDTEIEDLMNFNIGLMPLQDDEWTKGKCGFKALQYMSLGIPAIVSPVGVNSTIVSHGVDGFICGSKDEWANAITELYYNSDKRIEMGKAARKKVEEKFSVLSNTKNFIDLFN